MPSRSASTLPPHGSRTTIDGIVLKELKGGTMRQTSKFLLALAAVALLALPAGQVFAGVQNLQGGMFDVGTAPSTDPFAGKCVQERMWSVINSTVINGATCPTTGVGSCALGKDVTTQACNRSWLSNAANSTFPGYFSHTDNIT